MSYLTLHSTIAAEEEGGQPAEATQDFRSLESASKAVIYYIHDRNIGREDWVNPQIRENGQVLAEIDYDGVVWDSDSGEVIYAERLLEDANTPDLEFGLVPVVGHDWSLKIYPEPKGSLIGTHEPCMVRGREVALGGSYRFDEAGLPDVHVAAHWQASGNDLNEQIKAALTECVTNAASAWVATPEAHAMAARNMVIKHRSAIEKVDDQRRLDAFTLKRSAVKLAWHQREIIHYEARGFGVPEDASGLPAIGMWVGPLRDQTQQLDVPASAVEQVITNVILPDLLQGVFTHEPRISVCASPRNWGPWIRFEVGEEDKAHLADGLIAFLSDKLSNLSLEHQQALWSQATPEPVVAPKPPVKLAAAP